MSNKIILTVDLERMRQICDFLGGSGQDDLEFDVRDELMDLAQSILQAEIIRDC